jgi:hypothetical protein
MVHMERNANASERVEDLKAQAASVGSYGYNAIVDFDAQSDANTKWTTAERWLDQYESLILHIRQVHPAALEDIIGAAGLPRIELEMLRKIRRLYPYFSNRVP